MAKVISEDDGTAYEVTISSGMCVVKQGDQELGSIRVGLYQEPIYYRP